MDGDTTKVANLRWYSHAFGGFVMQPMVAKICEYVKDSGREGQSYRERVSVLDRLMEPSPSCQEVDFFFDLIL